MAALHNLRNGFTYYIDCTVILLSLQCSAHVRVEQLVLDVRVISIKENEGS